MEAWIDLNNYGYDGEKVEEETRKAQEILQKYGIDEIIAMDREKVAKLHPFLLWIWDALHRTIISKINTELEVRIPYRFEELERIKVETFPTGNCYNKVLGCHRYAHIIIPKTICDDTGYCLQLGRVKVIDKEGKIKYIDLPEIDFYVRAPITKANEEMKKGKKKDTKKTILNKRGKMIIALTIWPKRKKPEAYDFLEIRIRLLGHALTKRKDRVFIKKTKSGKIKFIQQKLPNDVFLSVKIVDTINGREWIYYNRVFRKKAKDIKAKIKDVLTGKEEDLYIERKVLQKPLINPGHGQISFGNQILKVKKKTPYYKYLLKYKGVKNRKKFWLIWEERPLNHYITAQKPVDVHEEFIEVNGIKIGKRWIIGSNKDGAELDIYSIHHMEKYTKIHVSLNANDVLIIEHRDPELDQKLKKITIEKPVEKLGKAL